jgi:hypothetical protein
MAYLGDELGPHRDLPLGLGASGSQVAFPFFQYCYVSANAGDASGGRTSLADLDPTAV